MSDEQQRPDLAEWARSLDTRRAELRDEEAEFEQAVRVRDRKKETAYRQAHPEQNPTTAYYRRADMSKAPTSEAGQRASIEGTAAAEGWTMTGPGLSKAVREHNRRVAARSGLEIDRPRADVLREQLLALFDEMEETAEVRRAGQEAAHGIRGIADRYALATSYDERDSVAREAGGSLSLAEAGLIRRLSKALEASVPDLIVDAHVDGMSAASIARELGCSDRHAYKVISDYPWEAQWTLYRATGPDTWEPVGSGTVQATDTADDLAERILADQVSDDAALARRDIRVCVWWTADDLTDPLDPDDARATVGRAADTPLDH